MSRNILNVDNISFKYDEDSNYALSNVSFSVQEGEWLAIVGHNGSGKSTLARILNGLLLPLNGQVTVNDIILTEDTIWEIRKKIGMVFQNPDNQFVGTTVKDDVAFGMENNGVPVELMVDRIDKAIKSVKMEEFLLKEPHQLSGGQKQRVAIAGVLAVQPDLIILDEATSMLDPKGKEEVLETIRKLKTNYNITVVSITHDLDEASKSDRIIVMKQGEIFAQGSPTEIFALDEQLVTIGLDIPFSIKLSKALIEAGIPLSKNHVQEEELVDELMEIKFENLEHKYQIHSPFEKLALYDINATIQSGSFTAIIGHTGSGKSTILQHLNGLLKPTSGKMKIGDRVIIAGKKDKDIKSLRKKVGIVFQFPEHQLFEETIEKDICFGPLNFGVPLEIAKEKARAAIKLVGLTEEYLQKSPFDLSGGQMRRVAIAGILAMEPEVIVLDEPTAGLDPRGRYEIMDMFYQLHTEKNLTTILVTHSMEDAAKYADDIIVMNKGTIVNQGSPDHIFSKPEELIVLGLDIPEVARFKYKLEQKFGINTSTTYLKMDEIVKYVGLLIRDESEKPNAKFNNR